MEETNFNSLTKEMIQHGMEKTDAKYNKRRPGKAIENEEFIKNLNVEGVKITEADMELINEFLDV